VPRPAQGLNNNNNNNNNNNKLRDTATSQRERCMYTDCFFGFPSYYTENTICFNYKGKAYKRN